MSTSPAPHDAEFYLPFKKGDPRNDQGLCRMFYKWEYTTYPDGETIKRLCYHSYAGLWMGSDVPHHKQEEFVKNVLKPITWKNDTPNDKDHQRTSGKEGHP